MIFTYRLLCLTPFIYILLMTSQLIMECIVIVMQAHEKWYLTR